jgi:hypothetical protein
MGMRFNAVHLLSQTLPLLDDLSDKKFLTLGVQDCYFPYVRIIDFLRRHSIPYKPINASEVLLTTGFKWVSPKDAGQYRNNIHQKTLFRLLGFSSQNLFSMDVSDFEEADIIHDLNVPIDNSLASKFDLVFDGGTIEHVFSTKDALFNMCRLCKVGGIVVNYSPVDFINHGFINLSAEILRDCYLANGFEEISLKYVAMPIHPRRVDQHYLEYRPDQFSFSLQPYYMTGIYSAFRKVEEKPLTVPMQGFYRKLHATGSTHVQHQGHKLAEFLLKKAANWVHTYFISSALVGGFLNKRRGRKVIL